MASAGAIEGESGISEADLWDLRDCVGEPGLTSLDRRWRQRNVPVKLISRANSSLAACTTEVADKSIDRVGLPPATTVAKAAHGHHDETDSPVHAPNSDGSQGDRDESSTAVMSMLFADAVGFSQLNDLEVPLFIDHFLGLVAGCVNAHAGQAADSSTWEQSEIPVRETWGDGLFFAFRNVATAGRFALDLCDAVRQTNWQDELGFSNEFKIRSALHTGPVRLGTDPITGLPKCIGTHV